MVSTVFACSNECCRVVGRKGDGDDDDDDVDDDITRDLRERYGLDPCLFLLYYYLRVSVCVW